MEVKELLPYGRQSISQEDIKAVTDVLTSSNLTQGPKIPEFEKALADYCGCKYAVAVSSATAGLHLSALAAGISPGDEVVSTPITFVASTNSAFYVGAKPVFADINPHTVLIDPKEVEKKLNARTRAVVPVHFAGQSVDMAELKEVVTAAEKKWGHKITIIEDAAHALGGTYRGTKVGSCAFSDMTVLSFHPVKQITTGEGGAVLTNDERLYRKLNLLRSHGITRDLDLMEDTSSLPWGYEQQELGFHYRMTDIQAALGVSQMKRLDEFVKRRREIATKYRHAFKELKTITVVDDQSDRENAYHLFVIRTDFERLGGRSKVMETLKVNHGLLTQVHYIPVHTQPYYRKKLGTRQGDFPHAEKYYNECLSIPNYPALTDAQVDRVIQSCYDVFR